MSGITTSRQIIFASRPKGMPNESNFSIRETSHLELKKEDVLVRTLYLSVDPYMRGRMNDRPSYIAPFDLNAPLIGGGIGVVIESKSPDFKPGDLVQGYLIWADYSVVESQELFPLNQTLAPISTALGVLGMPGMTAYYGLLEIGRPKKGETVVVSGAAGAVGMTVGQIAKIKGCRVVGIVGNEEKRDILINDFGFDAAVSYKKQDYADELTKACPQGVDIYFDNVGGEITDHVLKLINKHARVVICGQISMYNLEKPDIGPRNLWLLLAKSSLAQGFIISDHMDRFPEGISQMAIWIKEGKLKYKEHVVKGLENAPKAFLGLFKGDNIGKQVVKVSDH